MKTAARRTFQLVSLLTIITGCGGGGGGSETPKNIAPTASYTTSIDTSIDSLTVTFDGSSSVDTDGNIREFLWDFGDGNSGTGQTNNHRYSNAGSYTTSLRVTDNSNASDTVVTSVDISVVIARATLSEDPNGVSVGALTFDATASEVLGPVSAAPTIASYLWDFGDGSTAAGAIVYHTYELGSSFPATLTVTDNAGNQDSLTLPTAFSLSGVISAASNTVVDIDVNDPSRQNRHVLGSDFQTNNETYNAQPLTNPVIVNGFANEAGTGEPISGSSNFSVDTDRYDLYSVYLLKDQFVSLRVADFDPNNRQGKDLDLATLVGQIPKPPFRKLGVFDLEMFFTEKQLERTMVKLFVGCVFVFWVWKNQSGQVVLRTKTVTTWCPPRPYPGLPASPRPSP